MRVCLSLFRSIGFGVFHKGIAQRGYRRHRIHDFMRKHPDKPGPGSGLVFLNVAAYVIECYYFHILSTDLRLGGRDGYRDSG